MAYPILDRINNAGDVRKLSRADLKVLADEIRARLIDVCSRTGGHIGAGLGVVELTIALHYALNTPDDQLVWDVGHQAYPHKLITGRNSRFETLRHEGGISGFLKRSESEYDTFGAGHAATSISAALGMAAARDVKGEKFKVAAIIGDGSLGSGLSYEGLNNAGHSDTDIIVVLNDNEMSIAPNVGAMHKYLTNVRRNPLYNRMRAVVGDILTGVPAPFTGVGTLMKKWEDSVKALLTPGMLFEELGFRYFGPIDGHDINAMIDVFSAVRGMTGPRLVHVITQKGKGFPAGENGEKWHALPPGHDPATGKPLKVANRNPAYTAVFGKGLVELGKERSDVTVITAAMPSGTGTGMFAKEFPDRFFDVGIAEAHAVTFASGMATRNLRPIVAIYSTFLQRGYDSVIHDCAIQGLPVLYAMDRAGLVGEDGETHMGLYDIAYMLTVPGMTVTAPRDGNEMLALLRTGLEHNGPFSVRFPRDVTPDVPKPLAEIPDVPYGTWEVLRKGSDVAILATGTMVNPALEAAEMLAPDGFDITVVNCRFIKPYDEVMLNALLNGHSQILTVEEGTVINGFGAYMSAVIQRLAPGTRVAVHGVPDRIIYAAGRGRQLNMLGLDVEGIAARVRALHETEALAG